MNIKLNNIIKKYGDFKAVDSINLDIQSGEMLGLVGPNGSGKTTLLKLILGILKPTIGNIEVDGQVLDESKWKEYKRGVGYMPERVSFYDNLTGIETLKFFGHIKGGSIDNIKDVLERLFTKEILNKSVGSYSKGMRQRLNFAQSIINDPNILIFDEPTSGLDPIGIREFYDILGGIIKRKNPIIILSSHILAEIEDRVTSVGILKDGQLHAIGTLNDLYKNTQLPLKLYIKLKTKNDEILNLLIKQECKIIMSTAHDIHCEFPKDNKMKILSSLMELQINLSDFIIREPSLEEVFFGLN